MPSSLFSFLISCSQACWHLSEISTIVVTGSSMLLSSSLAGIGDLDIFASFVFLPSNDGSSVSLFLLPLDNESLFFSFMEAMAAAREGDMLLARALTREVLPLKPGLVSGSLNSSTGEGLVLADLSSDWLDWNRKE